ncbi:fumarylacetoacetate hydrolase family protein [Ilumatobacter coccineus]|uniref:Fumarylacetoacetate hydrolase family protein n=1 Tax=Ilumatobacter coccineus (strain NBRC 103263 / KCTC 29153 / YM16-304) TaxID=1313172 RepID=A0A6C7E0W5_ILUCY|nr:fumarylacetoacetate hydrolase family protein [Ilumatobacter coccineus]BAN00593.1 fumarylacetoacetate hydrolase family protein [Ilumatobacter coccineus YM16-304]
MGFRLANVDGRAALVTGNDYVDLETISDGSLSSDPMAALQRPERLAALAARLGDASPTGSLDDATLLSPVPRPRNVFAIGLNYSDHAAESNMEPPSTPLVFTKFPSCICAPNSTIELRSDFVDYEVEMVVVIGPGGKDIAEADAWNHVAGLTVGQDVSDRRMQFAANPPHFGLAKSFDTYGPIGPVVVSVDEVGDPDDLAITCSVNGDVRQNASTSGLIFGVPTLINHLSHVTTLAAGDLIFTGTPAGVGGSTGNFLADGDLVESTIAGIGTITNRCIRVGDHA